MNPLLIAGLALALLVLVAVLAAVFGKRGKPAGDARYLLRGELLSAAERAFFGALDAALGGRYRVFAMVRVADVIGVEAAERGAYLSAFNRISAKHFDFVICALDTLTPLAAIELNDASHQRPDRQKRDELLRGICRDIGLPLIELAPRRAYKLDSLRQQVPAAMGVSEMRGRREPYAAVPRPAFEREPDDALPAAAAPMAVPSIDPGAPAAAPVQRADAAPATVPMLGASTPPVAAAMPTLLPSAEAAPAIAPPIEPPPPRSATPTPTPPARREPTLQAAPATPAAAVDAPRCPKCDGELQRRRLATGQLAGREFWLCRTFPACSGMLPAGAV